MTFSFGASTAPAGGTGGFTLGAPPAKTSAAPSFGFGSSATPTAAVAPTVGGFGATPATTTPAFGGFGAAQTTQAKPVGFGLPQPQATAAVAPTLGGFGQASTSTAAAPAFGGFGAAAATKTTTPAPAFGGFGTPASTATVAPTLGGFGATTTSAAPPSFGQATSTAPTLGGFGATSTAPTLGGFGATSTAPTLGGFGATSTAPTLGGFGATSTAPTLGGFGATTSTATATVSGLGGNTNAGGLLGSQAGKPAVSEENKTDGATSKESPIPAELNTVVETFKNFIKEEKSVSSEISHNTDKQMKQVKEDTEGLSHLVSSLSSTLQSNRLKLEQLKQSCGQELVSVDICVKTRDTPASMQYDNVAPMGYFSRLVAQFEQSMLDYRQAIQNSEQHLESLSSGSSLLSAEDIVAAVQRLHQAMTHLAAKYQLVHTAVTELKCEYQVQSRRTVAPPAVIAGPSPFTAPADPLTRARMSISGSTPGGPPVQSLGTQQATFGQFGATSVGFNNSNTFGGNSSMFGAQNNSFASNTSVSIGTKRNKH